MSRIFISYRRKDSAGYAGRLYDHLSDHFSENALFMDVDNIQPGEDFVEVLETAVGSCTALVAVIGPDWLSVTDASGQRRLDDPLDFVRIEIAAALERNIRLIPVLVGAAKMPSSDQLPDSLKKLARRNALEVRHESFRADTEKLVRVLERILNEQPVSPAPIAPPPPAVKPIAQKAAPIKPPASSEFDELRQTLAANLETSDIEAESTHPEPVQDIRPRKTMADIMTEHHRASAESPAIPTNDELIQMGILAAKAGNNDSARTIFEQILDIDEFGLLDKDELDEPGIFDTSTVETAALWMAKIAETQSEQKKWVERVLALNPNNEEALKLRNELKKKKGGWFRS